MEVLNGFFAVVKRDRLGQNVIAIHSGCKKKALPETSLFFFCKPWAQKMLVSYKKWWKSYCVPGAPDGRKFMAWAHWPPKILQVKSHGLLVQYNCCSADLLNSCSFHPSRQSFWLLYGSVTAQWIQLRSISYIYNVTTRSRTKEPGQIWVGNNDIRHNAVCLMYTFLGCI